MRPPGFARDRARRLIASPRELLRVIEEAWAKLGSSGRAGPLQRVAGELKTMLDLVRAWAKGDYADVSRANLLLLVGAVVYFLVPLDLVPDFLAGAGFVDDAGVILWAVGAAGSELEKFRAWQASGPSPGADARQGTEAGQPS